MSEMEGRSYRNNIRVGGVIEEKGGTWEGCEVLERLNFYLLKYLIITKIKFLLLILNPMYLVMSRTKKTFN